MTQIGHLSPLLPFAPNTGWKLQATTRLLSKTFSPFLVVSVIIELIKRLQGFQKRKLNRLQSKRENLKPADD